MARSPRPHPQTALAIVMTIEKMTATRTFSRAMGLVLIAAGLGFVVSALM
jgi:hypothetical protein